MIKVIKVNLSSIKEFYALCENGILLKEVNLFLMDMVSCGGKRGRGLTVSSQKQYAYVLKQLFDNLSEHNLIWNKVEKKDFAFIVKYLDIDCNINRERINYLTNLWVKFYKWCELENININLQIKTFLGSKKLNMDDDFLAHARLNKIMFTSHEFSFTIPTKRKIRHLSPKTVKYLLVELKKIDIVYYVITYFMVTSGLRISGALQLESTSFPHYLETEHLEWLTYNYISKGHFDSGQTSQLQYSLKGWQHISKSFALIHNNRAEKYYDNYGKWPQKYFLKENGKELYAHEIWSKFREVSKKLDIKITPHMLRHTYAVLFVLKYSKKKGIEPTSKTFFWDIHKQLQKNLGHVDISTTMHYCEAAYDYVTIGLLDEMSLDFNI